MRCEFHRSTSSKLALAVAASRGLMMVVRCGLDHIALALTLAQCVMDEADKNRL
jgi:hypothetical protein